MSFFRSQLTTLFDGQTGVEIWRPPVETRLVRSEGKDCRQGPVGNIYLLSNKPDR